MYNKLCVCVIFSRSGPVCKCDLTLALHLIIPGSLLEETDPIHEMKHGPLIFSGMSQWDTPYPGMTGMLFIVFPCTFIHQKCCGHSMPTKLCPVALLH